MAQLLLLRHGIAEPRSPGEPDESRPLTAAGRQRTRAVLQRLRDLKLHGDRMFCSPLLRARQTAELALAAGLAPDLQISPLLAPGGDPLPLLAQAVPRGRLALVGHEPDLGRLATDLIGAPPGSLVLRKAGLAVLEWPDSEPAPRPGATRLLWLLAPRLLLGGS